MIKQITQWIALFVIAAGTLLLGFVTQEMERRQFLYLVLLVLGIGLALAPLDLCVCLLFLYIGFEGFFKLLSGYNPIVHVGSDIIIVFLWGKLLFMLLLDRFKLPNVPPFSMLFFIHWGWFIVAMANPYSLSLLASLAGAKLYVTIVSLYFMGYYLATDIRKIRMFMATWVAVAIAQAIVALYQASIGPSSVTSLGPAWAMVLKRFEGLAFRPFGLGAMPGVPSIYIYMCVPFMLYFIFYSRKALTSLALAVLLPACLLTILVCQVRSALLKAIIGALGYASFVILEVQKSTPQVKRTVIGIFTVAVPIIIFVMPMLVQDFSESHKGTQRGIERTLTLFNYENVSKARSGALDRFFAYATMAPLGAGLSRNGAGAAKFESQVAESGFFLKGFFTDNLWLQLVIDLGIPGMIIFTSLFSAILLRGMANMRTSIHHEFRTIRAVILVTLVAIVIGAYGAEPLLYDPEGPFFWFFCGVLIKLPELELTELTA